MKSPYRLVVILFAICMQNGKLLHCFAAPTPLDNEIHLGSEDAVMSFREEYALLMKSYMKTSVNPCDDFYEFACGNYPNPKKKLVSFRERSKQKDIRYVLNDLIEVILQKHRQPDEKFYRELQKAKHFFESCLDADLWSAEPAEEFLEVLNAIGGFPAIDSSWNASAFDWFNMTAHLSRYGINGLIKEEISEEHPFPPYYELPKFGFGVDVYLENIASKTALGFKSNVKEMRNLLKVYGVSRKKSCKIINDIIKFWREALLAEKASHEYCDDRNNSDDSDYNAEFSKWNSFFEIAWEGTKFSASEESACPCDWYYNKLDKIISKRPEAVANYMALKFLFVMHYKKKSAKSHRTLCLNLVQDEFPILLSHFYIKEHYNKAAEDDINEIVSEVRLSIRKVIEHSDWLDAPTRLEALKKIDAIRTRVGEHVDLSTEIYINEINNLNLTDNFAANTLKMLKFNVDMRHYGYLHPDMPKSTPPMEDLNAIQANAIYSSIDNSFNIFAGYLLPPVYHPDLPMSLNYGNLGFAVAHGISHAFDIDNSRYDSNLTERNWWTEKSRQAFKEHVNCFAQDYSDYKFPKLKLNLNRTISRNENMADSGGLLGALTAYRRVYKAAVKNQVKDFEKNESMPGLDMSPDQMFFLSFAQQFCSKNDLEDFWIKFSNKYPLDKYRVLGTLQNSEDFPLVFNCPLGSRMNPNEKCRLW